MSYEEIWKKAAKEVAKERDCLNDKLNQAYEDGYQMEGKYRDMKTQRDTLIDDIAVLRTNNERLERENHDLKKRNALLMNTVDDSDKENKHLKEYMKEETFYYQWQNCIDENEKLERENEKYIKLLKEFNNLINYKLAIHPGSDVYMYYRSELNKLGVK